MTKLKGIFAVSFIAMMSVGVASANIASQGYVDQEVGTRLSAISGSTSGAGNVVSSVSASGGTVTATKEITAEETKNKVTTVRATASATDTAYPSEKAVATALETKADIGDIPAAITVDTALSSTSTNPVQNKVINTALAGKLATTTYNTQIGTVSAQNMGTDATSVVTAIKEVAGEAAAAQETATEAQRAAAAAHLGATAAQTAATDARITANTKVSTAQGSGNANKAVITDASGNITTGTISSGMITDGAVTSAKIANGTITNDDISTNAAISASKISGLSAVATSGSYNSLTDKPTIPSAYTLPAATSNALGGVKSGGDITVAEDGAVTVDHATKADTATSAATATTATNATNATKAMQDGSGNVITTTYATKAQITELDSTSSGTGAVVTGVSQTDGKVTVTKGNVQIPVGGESATTYATIWVE